MASKPNVRHADPQTIDYLITLTKEVNKLRSALTDISHIDGSDPVQEINLARKIARMALFDEKSDK